MATVIQLSKALSGAKGLKSRGGRPKNKVVRTREHLTPDEVQRMFVAASQRGRYRNRDALLIMMA